MRDMSEGGLIFVAGHRGLVGSALVRCLERDPEIKPRLLTAERSQLDLSNQKHVRDFFEAYRPSYVYLAAARVGGIKDNLEHPAEFVRDNILIAANVIDSAYQSGAKKLLFLGSSCIYPKYAPQPLRPEYLLSGALEETNRSYAVAKIAGIEMCRAYRLQYGFNAISAMPSNLYGPGDNFHPENSHVLPALLQRFGRAAERGEKEVVVWGTGKPRREFLFVDDLAEAATILMDRYNETELINVGCGEDLSIADIATLVAKVTNFEGRIRFDHAMPDGTPQKILDVGPIQQLGWRARTGLEEGLQKTWNWYKSQDVSAVRCSQS
jgi:GDP-L-fucose synthase